MKICTFCNRSLDELSFYKDKQKKDGLRPRCKQCERENRNKEHRRQYEKAYWDERRSLRRKMIRESHRRNKDYHAAVRKEYLASERGRVIHRIHSNTRRAIERKAFVEKVDPIVLLERSMYKCCYCGTKITTETMEIDHYIPLSRGGEHSYENTRATCMPCNRSKGAKMPEEVFHQVV